MTGRRRNHQHHTSADDPLPLPAAGASTPRLPRTRRPRRPPSASTPPQGMPRGPSASGARYEGREGEPRAARSRSSAPCPSSLAPGFPRQPHGPRRTRAPHTPSLSSTSPNTQDPPPSSPYPACESARSRPRGRPKSHRHRRSAQYGPAASASIAPLDSRFGKRKTAWGIMVFCRNFGKNVCKKRVWFVDMLVEGGYFLVHAVYIQKIFTSFSQNASLNAYV